MLKSVPFPGKNRIARVHTLDQGEEKDNYIYTEGIEVHILDLSVS